VAQRVRELGIHNPRSGGDRFVTVSAGVTCGVPSDALTLETAIAGAHAALRHAKAAGRNTVGVAQEGGRVG
jgi:PleD family two-component response regulator